MRLAALISVASTLAVPVVCHAAPAAPKAMIVCINQATGGVIARPKCKKGETPLNLATVAASAIGPQGPQGPQGESGAPGLVNVSSCYRKEGEWQLTNDGFAYADVDCNDLKADFMLSDGFDYQPSVSIALTERYPVTRDGDTVPTGILISTVSPSKVYQLKAFITCCKR